jgi:hypothetical protein
LIRQLCDRALLGLQGREDGLTVTEPELQAELRRTTLLMSVTAGARVSPSGPAGPKRAPMGMPGAPPLPGMDPSLGPVSEMLDRAGLTEADLVDEVRADVLAEKVKRKHVYDAVPVSDKELLDAYRAMPSPPPAAPKALDAGKSAADAGPDDATLSSLRRRLQRERGADALAKLMADLRRRWKVELVGEGMK